MPAHVPESDIRQLRRENTGHYWSGLLKVVDSHRNQARGIENATVEMLIPVVGQIEQFGTAYPGSEPEFAKIPNRSSAKRYAA